MAEQKANGGQSLLSRAREAAKTALPAVIGSASFGTRARNKAGLSVWEVVRDAVKRRGALKAGTKVASAPLVKKAKQDLVKLNQNFGIIKNTPDRLAMQMPRLVADGIRTAGKLKTKALEAKASLEKFISANKGVKRDSISKAIKRKATPTKEVAAPKKVPAPKKPGAPSFAPLGEATKRADFLKRARQKAFDLQKKQSK